MQEKLKLEILKEGYEVQRKTVEDGLESKVRFVKSLREKELSESTVKRINVEEEYIRACDGLLQMLDDLIEAFEESLQTERTMRAKLRELNEEISKDAKDYQDKYYQTLLDLNDERTQKLYSKIGGANQQEGKGA
jgi:hypothetical protein